MHSMMLILLACRSFWRGHPWQANAWLLAGCWRVPADRLLAGAWWLMANGCCGLLNWQAAGWCPGPDECRLGGLLLCMPASPLGGTVITGSGSSVRHMCTACVRVYSGPAAAPIISPSTSLAGAVTAT